MFTNSNFFVGLGFVGLGGSATRSSVALEESRGLDGFAHSRQDSNSFGDEWKQLPREQCNIRRIRLGDKNHPKQHEANSELHVAGALNGALNVRTPARKHTLQSLQMKSNKKAKTAPSRHRKPRTVKRKSKLVQSTSKKSRRWYGESKHVKKFVSVYPEECPPAPSTKIKNQQIEPESEDDGDNSASLNSLKLRPSKSCTSSKLAKFNVTTLKNKNQIPANKNDLFLQVPARNKSVICAASNTNIPVSTSTKKEFRLPSSNWEPDSDDEDTSKPVLELPLGPRPFKLAFTNWIGEKQYEWDIHSKLMSLNHGTVVNVSNILHPDFWRDDINDASLTDYIVPFDPLRFSSKIFKF